MPISSIAHTPKPDICSPLKWHGGKHYLAGDIIRLMPHSSTYKHYVEPYAGGLSVLLARPTGHSEVVNDMHGDLTNFWRVLQSPLLFSEFQRVVEAMPFSQVEWEEAFNASNSPDASSSTETPVERAVRFFVLCRQSMAGRMSSFAPLSRTRIRRGMNEQASAWLNTIDSLPQIHARLRSVVVFNKPALDVITKEDSKHTLFYLDPPYMVASRAPGAKHGAIYDYDMTTAEHEELLSTLVTCDARIMLSSYPNPLYDEILPQCASSYAPAWKRHTFDVPNNAASGRSKARELEVVWTNY